MYVLCSLFFSCETKIIIIICCVYIYFYLHCVHKILLGGRVVVHFILTYHISNTTNNLKPWKKQDEEKMFNLSKSQLHIYFHTIFIDTTKTQRETSPSHFLCQLYLVCCLHEWCTGTEKNTQLIFFLLVLFTSFFWSGTKMWVLVDLRREKNTVDMLDVKGEKKIKDQTRENKMRKLFSRLWTPHFLFVTLLITFLFSCVHLCFFRRGWW